MPGGLKAIIGLPRSLQVADYSHGWLRGEVHESGRRWKDAAPSRAFGGSLQKQALGRSSTARPPGENAAVARASNDI